MWSRLQVVARIDVGRLLLRMLVMVLIGRVLIGKRDGGGLG